MALQRTQALPLGNYSTGRALASVTLRTADKDFYIELARATASEPTVWPNTTTVVTLITELSTDSGVSWRELASVTSTGGAAVARPGRTAGLTALRVSLPPGPNRRIRGRLVIVNGPLRTRCFHELRDAT